MFFSAVAAAGAALITACSSSNNATGAAAQSTQIAPAVACSALAAQLTALANTTIGSVTLDAGGETDSNYPDAGPVPEHCVVTGTIGAYTSQYVNPDTGSGNYGIEFELRMPTKWNGRFFYQGGGGGDGAVNPAMGQIPSQQALSVVLPQTPALWRGFAVVSSDGGHESLGFQSSSAVIAQLAILRGGFGIDPTARVNYGYASIGQVTPIAKQIISQYYAQPPAHSYFLGCSKGGQEAMQASQKYGDQFDGIVAGDPGFHLPHAAIAQAWDTQALAPVAAANAPGAVDQNGNPLLYKAFSTSELNLVRKGVLAACDALDGATDNMIFNTQACVGKFDPTTLQCSGTKRASCLSAAQVTALEKIFGGAKRSDNSSIYATFPYDTDMSSINGWVMWDLGVPLGTNTAFNAALLGLSASQYIFTTPPDPTLSMFTVDMDQYAQAITATSGDYNVSAVDFMEADSTDFSTFKNHGGKIIYFHGQSDPVFSMNDTVAYYNGLAAANGGDASDFARLFLVPGMNHCFGGSYATDNFDTLDAIVNWVENGQAPDRIIAKPGSTATTRLPAGTTRPLCAYPKYAHYNGSGDVNSAASFTCE
jgi:feruloyl esterase